MEFYELLILIVVVSVMILGIVGRICQCIEHCVDDKTIVLKQMGTKFCKNDDEKEV